MTVRWAHKVQKKIPDLRVRAIDTDTDTDISKTYLATTEIRLSLYQIILLLGQDYGFKLHLC
jgi:hypothetical protein